MAIFLSATLYLKKKKDIQKDKLMSYLCDENDFSVDRISSMIKKLDKVEEERSESLDKWFNWILMG